MVCLATIAPGVTHLNLSNCPQITLNGLYELVASLANLRTLSLHGCNGLSAPTGQSWLRALSAIRTLRHLDVSGIRGLKSDMVDTFRQVLPSVHVVS